MNTYKLRKFICLILPHKWSRNGHGGWGRTDVPNQWTQMYKCQRCYEFKTVENDTYKP